jgi:hypothetical protein
MRLAHPVGRRILRARDGRYRAMMAPRATARMRGEIEKWAVPIKGSGIVAE